MLVIQPDIGDDGEVRSRRVCGIQTSAETYLKDDEVTFLRLKELMGHHRRDFKE